MSAKPQKPETLLITLTGKDRPGVTSSIFSTLSQAGVEVLDIEQILLRQRLILGVLVTVPRDWKRLKEAVEATALGLGMTVEVDRGSGDNRSRREGRSHVTVIGSPLKAGAMAAIAGRIADCGGNIDRIERMARYPVTAIDLHVSGADPVTLRALLATEAAAQGIDVAVQPANLLRRGMRLIVLDVDSTLIQGEVIEMLAAHAGHEAAVATITEAAMRGEIDFEEALLSRVRLLEGLDESVIDEVYDAIVITPGARTMVRTLRRLGYRFAIVSGGFSQITDRLADDLGIHYARANELEIVDGKLTGRIVGDIVDRAGKAAALREFAEKVGVPEAAVIAIGDGANDLDMLNAAGLGIAYNARPVVQEAADTSVNVPYLDAIMYLLGISREEIEAADAEARHRHPLAAGLMRSRRTPARGRRPSCRHATDPRRSVGPPAAGHVAATYERSSGRGSRRRVDQAVCGSVGTGASSPSSPSSRSWARTAMVGLWPITMAVAQPSSAPRTRSRAVSGPAAYRPGRSPARGPSPLRRLRRPRSAGCGRRPRRERRSRSGPARPATHPLRQRRRGRVGDSTRSKSVGPACSAFE